MSILFQGSQHCMKTNFPEFPLRKFQHSMRNIFILTRLLGSQEVAAAKHNLGTWHKTNIHQTNQNLCLLCHCQIRYAFTDFFSIFSQTPLKLPFKMTGKNGDSFSGLSLTSRVAVNPVFSVRGQDSRLLPLRSI